MNLLVCARMVFFFLFTVCNCMILSMAAWNASVYTEDVTYLPVDVFLIVISALGIIYIIPIVLIDYLRSGTILSQVWFEMVWLMLYWVFYLAGAVAITSMRHGGHCTPANFDQCTSGQILQAFAWLAMSCVLLHLLTLLGSALYYSESHPSVWVSPIREFQWFVGGGIGTSTLHSNPGSPAPQRFKRFSLQPAPIPPRHPYPEPMPQGLPIMAAHTIRQHTLTREGRPAEPMVQVNSSAPGVTNALELTLRPPVHYTAVSSTTIGNVPGRRVSRDNGMNSLYPVGLQKALAHRNTQPSSSDAPMPPAPPIVAPQPQKRNSGQMRPLNLQGYSTYSSRLPTKTPPPVQNWPRTNPQEPIRKSDRSKAAPPYPSSTEQPSTQAPSAPAVATSTAGDRLRPSGPRHRPPPLDLSSLSAINRTR